MAKSARAPLAPTAGSASDTMPDWMKNYKPINDTSPDKTDRIRELATEARELRLEEAELDARLVDIHKRIDKIERQELPELMEKAGSDRYDLVADGNKPPYVVKIQDEVHANISSEWPSENRAKGFATVRALNGDPLIKNTFVLYLGPKTDELAQRIHKGLLKLKKQNPDAAIEIEHKETVQWNTLSAWLKTLINKGKEPTQQQLEAIGARIGKIAKIKPRKDG